MIERWVLRFWLKKPLNFLFCFTHTLFTRLTNVIGSYFIEEKRCNTMWLVYLPTQIMKIISLIWLINLINVYDFYPYRLDIWNETLSWLYKNNRGWCWVYNGAHLRKNMDILFKQKQVFMWQFICKILPLFDANLFTTLSSKIISCL